MKPSAADAAAQELAESAAQGSVGCFGFLAQDTGSDEGKTIKAGLWLDDKASTPTTPVQSRLGSPRTSSQSVQDVGSPSNDHKPQPQDTISIEPRDSELPEDRSSPLSHALPARNATCGERSRSQAALQPRPDNASIAFSSDPAGSGAHVSSSERADADVNGASVQHEQGIQHPTASQRGIQPPVPTSPFKSRRFFRWPSFAFKKPKRLSKNSMAAAA